MIKKAIKWTSEFSYDFTNWSFLFSVSRGKYYWEIWFLCFGFSRFAIFPDDDVPLEEQLRELNKYTDEQMEFIAEERQKIMSQLGIQTGDR